MKKIDHTTPLLMGTNTRMKTISLTTRLSLIALLGTLTLCLFPSVQAEDTKTMQAARGTAKVNAVCAMCHDASGISKSADFPILAGQHEDYLREALYAYKRGDRKNPIMKAQASALSDQDIEDVAAYYSRQPAGLITPKH